MADKGAGKGWGKGGMLEEQPLERRAKTHICATTGRGRKCPRGEITGARGGKYAGFFFPSPEMSHLNHGRSRLPVTDSPSCATTSRVTDRYRRRRLQESGAGGGRDCAPVPCTFARFWAKGTTVATRTHARTRINDRGVKASRTGPAASPGCARRQAREVHPGMCSHVAGETRWTSNSRDVKGKSRRQLCETRRNIFTFSAKIKDRRRQRRLRIVATTTTPPLPPKKPRKESTHCF